jgi:hypothetical protein
MSTEFFRNYIDIIKEAEQPRVQLDEGMMDSISGLVAKIKAIPGIQRFIQAAQAKKTELIQAAQRSQNGADLVKNIQAAVGGQQAVAEGLGDKITGAVVASAGGGLMAAGADLFMKAWIAMGKPDLTTMTGDGNFDGRIVVALVSMLVLTGAVAMIGGAQKIKQGMQPNV